MRGWNDPHAAVIAKHPQTITPYVGEGEEGCRRSAQIVRDEIASLPSSHPRREALEEQARAWDYRAESAAAKETER